MSCRCTVVEEDVVAAAVVCACGGWIGVAS